MKRSLICSPPPRWSRWLAAGALCLGCACSRPLAPPAREDAQGEHEEAPGKVQLSAAVAAAAGIRTAPAAEEALLPVVDLTGEVVADADRSARVAARVPGRIVEVRFKEGDRVKAGDVLAIIESPELGRARAALTAAGARAQAAARNAARLERLAGKGLAAGQDAASARAEAASLEAEARAARQTLLAFGALAAADAADAGGGAARLPVRAPMAGSVLRRDAVSGQAVTADHVIAEIADLDRAYFQGRLFEKDLARVAAGAAAEVRLNAYPGQAFPGTVETIGKRLDPGARTVVARIAIKDRGDLLKIGLSGSAAVTAAGTEGAQRRVVVPLGALARLGDRDHVFVRREDGEFVARPVELGRAAGGRVEVLSGLRPGEPVVIDGIFTVKSALLKSSFAEEH